MKFSVISCKGWQANIGHGIKFLKLKYKIPESASTTGRRASGTMTLDWIGYADDLILIFEDELSLSRGISLLN